MSESSVIPVYKHIIAKHLINENFPLDSIYPNLKHPGNTVYYFKKVPGLQNRINQLVNQMKRGLLNDNFK